MSAMRLWDRLPRHARVLAASLLLILGPTLLIGQVATIERIEISGNQRVDNASVRALLGLREGQEVTTAQVNDAYQRLMAAGLFESATITPDGATLAVVVKEWPVVNRVAFEGNRRLEDAALAAIV
ncbi:MAG: FtsQ-type POTRA domain-containing protein, partial [Alphaproteobacteria bacterium]|nr:FtsQ-type POTRA domain-containing protein [Alphaproteobacteria bacterium]